jgi:hypothetical protein
LQRLLGRLWTDAEFRARFRADPRGVGAEAGLSAEEAERLAGADLQAQVEEFARALTAKRAGEVARLLPLTRTALGPRFAPLFRRFAGGGTPSGTKKHRDDAVSFARSLADPAGGRSSAPEPTPAAGRLPPPWLVDLARFEAAWLESTDPRCRFLLRFFRRPVRAVAAAVARGEDPAGLPSGPSLCVWWRPSAGAHARFFAVGG